MAKTKAANYSEAQIAVLGSYETRRAAGEDNKSIVADIAAETGKSPASVRAKLSSMGVYVANEKVTTASTRRKKVDVVADIMAAGVPLNETEAEGLSKANASALEKVLARLTN